MVTTIQTQSPLPSSLRRPFSTFWEVGAAPQGFLQRRFRFSKTSVNRAARYSRTALLNLLFYIDYRQSVNGTVVPVVVGRVGIWAYMLIPIGGST